MRYLEDSMKILVGTSKYFVTLKVVGGKGILMSLSPILHWLLQIYPRTILVRGKGLGFTLLSRPNTSESMSKFAPSASNTAIAPEDLDILTCQRSAMANSPAGLSDWHMTVVCSKKSGYRTIHPDTKGESMFFWEMKHLDLWFQCLSTWIVQVDCVGVLFQSTSSIWI